MFERYTEQARRVIFFARYEASQFGSMNIATEHLLLGLLREDKHVVSRFLPNAPSLDDIRREIQNRVKAAPKVATSIDLPLSNECKRILAYANEESERLAHRMIGTEHILLGMLREKSCLAAEILNGHGLAYDDLQKALASSTAVASDQRTLPVHLTDVGLLAMLETHGFNATLQSVAKAREAANQNDWKTARSELQLALESLVQTIKEKLPGDETVLEGFDWQASIRGLNTGLSGEEDWLFHWRLTLLLAEVLLKRFEKRLNS